MNQKRRKPPQSCILTLESGSVSFRTLDEMGKAWPLSYIHSSRMGFEARAYQMRVAPQSALRSSTLMVMPTGFGKTAVEWMAMAEASTAASGARCCSSHRQRALWTSSEANGDRDARSLKRNAIVTYTGEIQGLQNAHRLCGNEGPSRDGDATGDPERRSDRQRSIWQKSAC